MGKIISVMRNQENVEKTVPQDKWTVLWILTALVVIVALIFPLISSVLIRAVYHGCLRVNNPRLAEANIIIMLLMLGLLMIMPFSMLFEVKHPELPLPTWAAGQLKVA